MIDEQHPRLSPDGGPRRAVDLAAVRAAVERARTVRENGVPAPRERSAHASRRTVAIGDPQASAERFFEVLAAHELLGSDGWLRDDVCLVSMGDHFDIDVADRERGRVDGVLILGWLAAHARDQVAILFGNHDAARVMELATVTDERFDAAATLGRAILDLPKRDRAQLTAEFAARFPELATPDYAARDYNAFTVEQRTLVRALLVARRFDLAIAAQLPDGRAALLTHAGVTVDQLDQLGLIEEREPRVISIALQSRLEAAIAVVAEDWAAGGGAALSLEPLHIAGSAGQEGGGLLYHRPADLDRDGADRAWESAARGARRFDPRQLPRGLVQVIGHTGHTKAFRELARWRDSTMDDQPGGLRTLRVSSAGDISYRRGLHEGLPQDAIVLMVDPEMRRIPDAASVAVLDLSSWWRTARWHEGEVNPAGEHFLLTFGKLETPIARLGRTAGEAASFVVEVLETPSLSDDQRAHALERVRRQLDFYLIELSERDPWRYARYHAHCHSNVYSDVHWMLFDPK